MFPSLYVHRSLCSPVLCSPVSMFPGPMFPGIYVPNYLCSPISMFPVLYSPVRIYVPQYLCSPVPIFPVFHNKILRDAESVISAIFTLSSFRMSVHPFWKVFTTAWWVLLSGFEVADKWSRLLYQGHRGGGGAAHKINLDVSMIAWWFLMTSIPNLRCVPVRWSWTVMNSSWMFVNKKLWRFMNVMNIIEQQMRLSWKFKSSWTYSVHEPSLRFWAWVVHERS